jgi:hypothetical protein
MGAIRAKRERHGRPIRGAMLAHLNGTPTLSFFETVVTQTVNFLKTSWPEELQNLEYRVADSPVTIDRQTEVPRFRVNKAAFRITIYRIPIERLSHHKRTDRLDERFHIEQFVFQAVAELVGRDPGDLIPDQYKR